MLEIQQQAENMKKYQELFRTIPLFRGITDQERETMLDCLRAREQRFSADSVILVGGQVADCVDVYKRQRLNWASRS